MTPVGRATSRLHSQNSNESAKLRQYDVIKPYGLIIFRQCLCWLRRGSDNFNGTKKLVPSAYSLIRALLIVLEFFNPEAFVDLRQSLRDEFSIRLRAVAFPIQRGIEPTNVEARHLWPQREFRRGYIPKMQRQAPRSAIV